MLLFCCLFSTYPLVSFQFLKGLFVKYVTTNFWSLTGCRLKEFFFLKFWIKSVSNKKRDRNVCIKRYILFEPPFHIWRIHMCLIISTNHYHWAALLKSQNTRKNVCYDLLSYTRKYEKMRKRDDVACISTGCYISSVF